MQVLKDPITRRAYDQQLSAEAVQSTVAVSAEVRRPIDTPVLMQPFISDKRGSLLLLH